MLTNASRELNPCGSVARTVDLRFICVKKKRQFKCIKMALPLRKKILESASYLPPLPVNCVLLNAEKNLLPWNLLSALFPLKKFYYY
jgi:hypothetical protein